jgi:2-succinyl-5-enolpyruvyl-6-hydroxy-3-cyclohexene-1-carboxylate synthase
MPLRLASAPLASVPNINHLWAALLVEELVRQGTTLFVVCPGSRSTPLAVAVAQNPRAEALVHWDERAAGFVALGWGRATGRPAAAVTTSGTAVANLLPAAVEADADGVPLLLLTADRPPELRETGANQTIRQPPIFQDVARWALDWPVPTADVPARWVLSTAAHAVQRARQPAGPVHLNLPFREPLAATPDGTDATAYLAGVEGWTEVDRPFVTAHDRQLARVAPDAHALPEGCLNAQRGLIVVGELAGREFERRLTSERIGKLGSDLGWPVLPDVRAPFRMTADVLGDVIPNVDAVLVSETSRWRFQPDAVLHVGGRLVSKRLATFLREARPPVYVEIGDEKGRADPDILVTHRAVGRALHVLDSLTIKRGARAQAPEWQQAWKKASRAVASVLSTLDGDRGALSEPAVARAVAGCPEPLVVAASMPIRDVEAYAPTSRDRQRVVIANRGASGIDGTVATAHGVARGLGAPVIALVGDLALLHDQTSLALLRDGPPVIVVCVNNDGGGIFHRLPIASGAGQIDGDAFERFFGTPHGLTFEHAAAQVGLAYHAPTTTEQFDAALDTARQSGASALIEVRTDRHEQAALRRRIEAACADAVDAALAEFDA